MQSRSKCAGTKAFDIIESFPKYDFLIKSLTTLPDGLSGLLELKTVMNELQNYYCYQAGIAAAFDRSSRLPFDDDYRRILDKIVEIKPDYADDFYIGKCNSDSGEMKDEDMMMTDKKRDPQIVAVWEKEIDLPTEEEDYENFELLEYEEFEKGYHEWKNDGIMYSKDFAKEMRIIKKDMKKKMIDKLFYLPYPTSFIIYISQLAVEKYSEDRDIFNYVKYISEVMRRKMEPTLSSLNYNMTRCLLHFLHLTAVAEQITENDDDECEDNRARQSAGDIHHKRKEEPAENSDHQEKNEEFDEEFQETHYIFIEDKKSNDII